MIRMRALAIALLVGTTVTPLAAQWISYPTPGIPRTADGKPNLSEPAPRTADGRPDLSGIWRTGSNRLLIDLAADGVTVPFSPWARALFEERLPNNGKDAPAVRCVSHGVTDYDASDTPTKIIQTPSVTVILYEAYNHYRQIFTDGRPLPHDPQPAWLGYSVGRWEGETFVAETIGLNDQTWLDTTGHPHTESLHITERFHRRDFGHMDIEIAIDDMQAYTKPWSVTIPKSLMPDTDLIEFMCENEKDHVHMVGK